jgi:hypothetical protein
MGEHWWSWIGFALILSFSQRRMLPGFSQLVTASPRYTPSTASFWTMACYQGRRSSRIHPSTKSDQLLGSILDPTVAEHCSSRASRNTGVGVVSLLWPGRFRRSTPRLSIGVEVWL